MGSHLRKNNSDLTSATIISSSTTRNRSVPEKARPNPIGCRCFRSGGRKRDGRWMAIVTSPENLKKLDSLQRDRAAHVARRGLTDEQAKALAAEGKSIIWIDGGLHANEVLGAQQLIELRIRWSAAPTRKRCASSTTTSSCRHQSRRHGTGLQLVHARSRSAEAVHGQRPPAPLQEVRRAR